LSGKCAKGSFSSFSVSFVDLGGLESSLVRGAGTGCSPVGFGKGAWPNCAFSWSAVKTSVFELLLEESERFFSPAPMIAMADCGWL